MMYTTHTRVVEQKIYQVSGMKVLQTSNPLMNQTKNRESVPFSIVGRNTAGDTPMCVATTLCVSRFNWNACDELM